MAIPVFKIDDAKLAVLKSLNENHFLDFKSKAITPSKLTRTICALGNADGGEVYIGIDDPKYGANWNGFSAPEEANGHIQIFEQLFPLGTGFSYSFLSHESEKGLVLKIDVEKSTHILKASDDKIYIRRGSQNLPVDSPEGISRLELNKGLKTFEDNLLRVDLDDLTNSLITIDFMLNIVPNAEPFDWLKKQKLIRDDEMANVCGVVLFVDEPQTYLPKTALKVYRYSTSDSQGSRETLEFDPITIEGSAYNIIYGAVGQVRKIIESISVVGKEGLEKVEYPTVAIHEIITNAVLHRDYSINDDVHVRIFDDRIEVESPGLLPGHITEKNILQERFVRNPKMFRIINKFRNPPNKDVGEGLNTSFEAMRALKLRDPIIQQRANSVLVTLKHEKLGSSEELIIDYLRNNPEINNTKAREICHIGDANAMKRVFQKMMKTGIIDSVPDRPRVKAGYVKGPKFPR